MQTFFNPETWGEDSHFDEQIFHMRWFNHQLDYDHQRWPVMITRDGEIGIVIPVLPLTQGNFNNYTLEEPENDGLEDDFPFPRGVLSGSSR